MVSFNAIGDQHSYLTTAQPVVAPAVNNQLSCDV